MANFKNFEEIIAWQKARVLCKKIRLLADVIQSQNDYRLKDQILGSSGSVMDNIAEGFERQGNKEFVNFLFIAKGSCGELRSQLYRVQDYGYVGDQECQELIKETLEISRVLYGLITSIQKSELTGSKYKP